MQFQVFKKTNLRLAFVFLIAFISMKLLGQETMNVPTISLPKNACTCSESEVRAYDTSLAELQEQLEQRKDQIMQQGVDEETMKKQALDGTNLNQVEVDKLMGMSESQQAAYTMQLARQYMKNPQTYTSNVDTAEIKERIETNQNVQFNYETIVNFLFPIELEIGKLKHEADAYYERTIVPMEERLAEITNTEAAWAYEKEIDKAKIAYCKKFTPPYHELLQQEIEAYKKVDPYLAELYKLKSDEIEGLEIADLATVDGALAYVSILLKAFDYRIVSVDD